MAQGHKYGTTGMYQTNFRNNGLWDELAKHWSMGKYQELFYHCQIWNSNKSLNYLVLQWFDIPWQYEKYQTLDFL